MLMFLIQKFWGYKTLLSRIFFSASAGQEFSYRNRTKNYIPVLVIPGSFMEFPGSLHPLIIVVTMSVILFLPCFHGTAKPERWEIELQVIKY